MEKEKKIEYLFSIIFCLILFFNLFVLNIFSNKYIFALFLLIFYIIASIFVKGKKIESIDKKKIILVVTVFSIIQILVLYIIGIFVGFYKNPITFSIKEFFTRIVPICGILVLSELIRNIFVTKGNKFSTILVTLALILIDISLVIKIYRMFTLENVLGLIGYVGLSSVSSNLLGNYLLKRHGYIPNIIYRTIITIYVYIIPIIPDIYTFFETVYKIICPYILYLIIDYAFTTDNFKLALKNKKYNTITLIIGIFIAFSIVLLVSCKFKYGIMVVGSSSMSNAINKGDAVIFEQYRGQELEEGQVIIFNKDNIKTIHRIDDIQTLNNKTVYYTKGDNNEQKDEGYRVKSDIIGIVKFRALYAGWPTIWINSLF